MRHISQPALSQHVRLLERKLFERDGRNMCFTHEGLAEARRVIGVHDASLHRLEAKPDLVSRSCTVHLEMPTGRGYDHIRGRFKGHRVSKRRMRRFAHM